MTPAIPSDAVMIAALYRFARLPDPQGEAERLRVLGAELGIMGTLILAVEGINGTVAGGAEAIAAMLAHIRALPGFERLGVKYASAPAMPFVRMKVKVKDEIVSLGAGPLDPERAGTYVAPEAWNALISDPDTVLIDTRNRYEVALGSFPGAIDPGTQGFREFPAWFDDWAAGIRAEGRSPKVAMFCTGGIRCEKSTALARTRGFDAVFHLDGGILRYLEDVPASESLWQGDCFVFDARVAVTHGLAPGEHVMCKPCGMPYRRGGPHDCAAKNESQP